MKNELILAICICILAVSIGIGSASANVTNIDTGEDFELIQEAIDDSDTKDGHTIVVGPGVYHENVQVNKSLAIRPINGDSVLIQAESSWRPVIGIVVSNVTINGIDIRGVEGCVAGGKTPSHSTGIRMNMVHDCCITNCAVSETSEGIRLWLSTRNKIYNNTIESTYKDAIYFISASNNTIKHNNIKESDVSGIYIGSHSMNNSILSNTIHGNNRNGVNQRNSNNSIIANNDIYDNHLGVGLYKSGNTEISNNTVYDNNWRGIDLYDLNNTVIANNNIYDNRWGGVHSYCLSNTVISKNVISDHSSFGMRLNESGNNAVINNTVTENGDGIVVLNETDSTIIGNNVSYNKKDGIYVKDSICEIRHNIISWNGEWGIHAIDSDQSVIEDNTCENNGIE